MVDPAVRRDRCRGSLLGLAVGDAFGWYFERKRPRAPSFPEMANGPHTDMRGDYEREIKAGQVTDDTQMACVIAHVLRLIGHYNQREAVKQYMNWKEHATGLSEWMKEVLGEISDARLPESIGRLMWLPSAWARSPARAAPSSVAIRTSSSRCWRSISRIPVARSVLQSAFHVGRGLRAPAPAPVEELPDPGQQRGRGEGLRQEAGAGVELRRAARPPRCSPRRRAPAGRGGGGAAPRRWRGRPGRA